MKNRENDKKAIYADMQRILAIRHSVSLLSVIAMLADMAIILVMISPIMSQQLLAGTVSESQIVCWFVLATSFLVIAFLIFGIALCWSDKRLFNLQLETLQDDKTEEEV